MGRGPRLPRRHRWKIHARLAPRHQITPARPTRAQRGRSVPRGTPLAIPAASPQNQPIHLGSLQN
eukprot:11212471-Lingulodinium_polyedra.AAC.1